MKTRLHKEGNKGTHGRRREKSNIVIESESHQSTPSTTGRTDQNQEVCTYKHVSVK